MTPIIVRPLVSNVMVQTRGTPAGAAPSMAALGFLDGGHCLDPDHVGAARSEPQGLFAEGLNRILVCEVANGLHEVAGRACGSCDQDVALRPVGHRPGQPCRFPVELADPVCGAVQLQPVGGSSEAVGEDDVGARQRPWSRDWPWTPSGLSTFRSSGELPDSRPAEKRLVAVAPSATSTPLVVRRCLNRSV